jgi:outer membrane protein assembly factor BamB
MRSIFGSLRVWGVPAVLVAALGGFSLVAADWPQFRGPNYNNISTETGLLKQWPSEGPPLVWKATGLGDGYATVSVAGNRIYTAGDKGESSFVTALDAATGQSAWSAKLGKPGPVGNPKFDGPRGTPTVDGDLIFAVSQWGELVCFDAANKGKELWRKDYVQDFGGVRPSWGYSESPLVDGDQVVVTPGGSGGAVVALNKKTGEVIWRSKEFTDPPHYSTITVSQIGGVRQYVQLTPQSVAGIAPADGKLLWRAPRKGQTAVIPSPVCRDGFVYVTSGYGIGCNLFEVTAADGKFSAKEVYANKVMDNKIGGVILVGDYVYGHADSKGWTCQDFKTGESKWQVKDKLGKGSIAYADSRFYLRADEGSGAVVLIEASPDGFKECGRFNQPDRSNKNSWPPPVIANGKLYLRDQGILLCYDIKAK